MLGLVPPECDIGMGTGQEQARLRFSQVGARNMDSRHKSPRGYRCSARLQFPPPGGPDGAPVVAPCGAVGWWRLGASGGPLGSDPRPAALASLKC